MDWMKTRSRPPPVSAFVRPPRMAARATGWRWSESSFSLRIDRAFTMHIRLRIFALLTALALGSGVAAGQQGAVDRLLDRIAEQERQFIENLRPHSALLE